jgi:hypothetical protein
MANEVELKYVDANGKEVKEGSAESAYQVRVGDSEGQTFIDNLKRTAKGEKTVAPVSAPAVDEKPMGTVNAAKTTSK